MALPFGVSRSLPSRNSIAVDGAHRIEDAAQDIHLLEDVRRHEQLFLAGAGARDVDRREGALVGDLAVENDFRIAGAFELFENHLVHARAGVDQRGRDDGQRAALLDIARGAEEALRPLQRIGVDAAGQHLAGGGNDGVVGAAKPRDRIEQDHDVAAMLDEALGLLDDHFGDLDMAHGRLVEGRGDDLAVHRALHVGDLLRALVDQQHDQIALGVIGGDRLRDILQKHGLAGAGRRDDEGALALADRRDDVDDAGGQILLGRIVDFELQALVRIERRQIVEMDLVADFLRVLEIDRIDLQKREIALALLRAADQAFDGVAGAQAKTANLRGRDIDVVGAGEIIRVGRAQKAEAVLQYLDHAFADDLDLTAGELLQDRKHQLLFAHDRSVFDFVFFSESQAILWAT